MIKTGHFSNHNSETTEMFKPILVKNLHSSNGETACKYVFNKLSFEAEQKQKNVKPLSQAPIMEVKQLYLQVLNDRSFLMENPEISITVTLQKAGWFNEEIYF